MELWLYWVRGSKETSKTGHRCSAVCDFVASSTSFPTMPLSFAFHLFFYFTHINNALTGVLSMWCHRNIYLEVHLHTIQITSINAIKCDVHYLYSEWNPWDRRGVTTGNSGGTDQLHYVSLAKIKWVIPCRVSEKHEFCDFFFWNSFTMK